MIDEKLPPGAINQLQTLLETDPRLYTHEQVTELVKAARELVELLELEDDYPFCRASVKAALKPFEGS
jgi:hypothetical protein